jgi:hypothetical protein
MGGSRPWLTPPAMPANLFWRMVKARHAGRDWAAQVGVLSSGLPMAFTSCRHW